MRYPKIIFVSLFMIWMGSSYVAEAQTCSCAGAPMINGQSVSSTSQGNVLVGLSHQYHDISNLYSGSSQIENPFTKRWTQSTLLEINYGLTDRLTALGTFTYVHKYRKTGLQQPGSGQTLITRGMGDGLFMLKYVLHRNTIQEQYQLAVGGGAKIPYGVHSLTQDGLQLNADMQPGTGAWDGVLWTYFSKTFAPAATLNLYWFSTFRRTGVNERFGADDRYRFGNELASNLGVRNSFADRFSYQLMLRYVYQDSDQRNEVTLPNTGGHWLYLKPGLKYRATERISLSLSGQLPVYQHLDGIQPTSRFILTGSVFYNFGKGLIF